MSLRSAIVDAMQAEATIIAICSTRITEYKHDFENKMNTAPNQFIFPAIMIQTINEEEEDNLDGHSGYTVGTYELNLYDTVKPMLMRSRSSTIRAKYETDIRALDALQSAVKTFLHSKRNTVVGAYHVRKSHIASTNSGILSETENETITQITMTYEVTFNAV